MYKQIKCIEDGCKRIFTLSERDLEFYAKNKYELPKRCLDCRKAKKQRNNSPFGKILIGMRTAEKKGRNYKPNNQHKKYD